MVASTTPARRWLRNLGMFYAIALAVGVALGVIGALGEDRFNQGVSGTITYNPPPGSGDSVTTVVQGTDADPRFLLFYPALVLFFGTVAVLPTVAVALLSAELLIRVGVPASWCRVAGVALASLALLLALDLDAGIVLLPALGLLAFSLLVRLPANRSAVRTAAGTGTAPRP